MLRDASYGASGLTVRDCCTPADNSSGASRLDRVVGDSGDLGAGTGAAAAVSGFAGGEDLSPPEEGKRTFAQGGP